MILDADEMLFNNERPLLNKEAWSPVCLKVKTLIKYFAEVLGVM